MAKLWKENNPGEEPIKRDTLYQGRPYRENTYFQKDYDMMVHCINEVMKSSQRHTRKSSP